MLHSYLRQGLLVCLFPIDFQNKLSPRELISPAYLNLLDLITLTMFI